MNRMFATSALIVMLQAGTASAQVHKCQGADGKTVYSDSPCVGGKASVIEARPNSIDTAAMREAGAAAQARMDRSELLANPPTQCRFKAYKYGDKKGQALKEAATAECVDNMLASRRGAPTTTMAYQAWKDHFDQTSTDRRAIAAQGQADANTQRIIDANEASTRKLGRQIDDKKYTCRRDTFSKDVICK